MIASTSKSWREKEYKNILIAILIALLLNALFLWLLITLPTRDAQFSPTQVDQDDTVDMIFDPTPLTNFVQDVPAALIPRGSSFGLSGQPTEAQQQTQELTAAEDAATGDVDGTVTAEQPEEYQPSTITPSITELARPSQAPPADLKKFALNNLREPSQSTNTTAAQPTPATPSIASITSGFLASENKGGQDLIERAGDRSKRPSIEETQWISYFERIGWNLQNGCRLSGAGCRIPFPSNTIVSFAIDHLGNVSGVRILRSSGNGAYDQAAITIIKAIGSFAAIPKHLNCNRLELGIEFRPNGYISMGIMGKS